MDIIQSIILGIVQGITEFLPISSSGHLILVPEFIGWEDLGLSFTVALHWGTLFGVVGYFYKDWLRIFKSAYKHRWCHTFTSLHTKNDQSSFENILPLIIIATIPAAITGYFLEDLAETTFRSPLIVASSLIGAGLFLFFADRFGKKHKKAENLNLKTVLIVGFAQAFAIIPGMSRSGMTIAAALLLGLRREEAARFSFLLSVPIILGAGILELPAILSSGLSTALILGFFASAISGFLAIKWLMVYVTKKNYSLFVVYRIVLGVIILSYFAL